MLDMAVHWRESRSEQNDADHDEQHRIGVADVKITASHFAQQKQDADRRYDNGTHEVADRAPRACASGRIAHLRSFLRVAMGVPKAGCGTCTGRHRSKSTAISGRAV